MEKRKNRLVVTITTRKPITAKRLALAFRQIMEFETGEWNGVEPVIDIKKITVKEYNRVVQGENRG